MAIEDKVKEMILEVMNVSAEQLTSDTSFIEDLGADSLDTVDLIMALEKEFGAKIQDEDAEKFTTLGVVVEYLKERGFDRSSA